MNINQLANNFLLSNDKQEQTQILTEVGQILASLTFERITIKTYRALNFSYLMGRNSSSKIEKGLKENIDSYVLYLSASKNAGFDVCTYASKFCREICLVESGRASMEQKNGNIHKSRLIKTWLYKFNNKLFNQILRHEINKAQARYIKAGIDFCIRLNGTSDLNFHSIKAEFQNIQFYDYTKNPNEILGNDLDNNHLTFSFSGSNIQHCKQALRNGLNIAVPVIKSDLERILNDFKNICFNGDITDLRFLDKHKSKICLLSVKGNHKNTSPFLLDYDSFKDLLNKLKLA